MAEYFSLLVKYLPLLLKGLQYTIIIAIGGIILGTILGIILCILSISKFSVLQKIANFYVTIVRGIPLMILALFLYFGVIKNALPVLTSAIIILGINASAFIAEIFRAGIQAIDPGQMEAARSLGLSYGAAMALVVVPQAIRTMIPSIINQFIITLKDTSILSVIGFPELTNVGKTIMGNTFKNLQTWAIVGVMYMVVIITLSKVSKKLERRINRGR